MTPKSNHSIDFQNGNDRHFPVCITNNIRQLLMIATLLALQAVSCTTPGQNYPSPGFTSISPTGNDDSPYGSPAGQSLSFPAYQPPQDLGIEREQVGLTESNPIFDGEVDQMLNGMQSTAPSLEMHTFRTGSSEIIPQGIGNLQPIESERDALQLQSQMGLTPMPGSSGNAQHFGASEQSLADSHDEPLDFSAIMQTQQRLDSFSQSPGSIGPGYEPPQDSRVHARFVDVYDKQAVDTEVENMEVAEVIIEGNGKVPEHKIRNMIRTVKGEPFRLQTVQEDTRTLNQTGFFFSVTPRYQRKPEGVVVRFDLVERPIFHTVQFVGNRKIHKKKLAEESGIKAGDPVDVQLVLHAREKLKEYYRSEGFERASVVIASGDRVTDRNVVFIINEGVKQRVLTTAVEGGRFLSNTRLKTYIDSKPGVLYYVGGEFSREKLDADVEKLLELYQRYGFFNVQIDRVFEETTGYFRLGEPGSWIKVKFIISEGPRFKINNIIFVGNEKFTDAELSKEFKLKPGAYYLQGAMKLDEASVGRKYSDQGRLLTKVQGNVRMLADKPGMVDVTYAIRESDPVAITGIAVEFAGTEAHTKTTTLLKHLAIANIKPGRVAQGSMIRRAETSVSRPGFVNVNPAEGVTPRIHIVPEDGEMDMDDEDFLDMDLQEIDDIIMRGQNPGDNMQSALDLNDWRQIQVGVHPAFPDAGPLAYHVAYPQTQDGYGTQNTPQDAPLYSSNPYNTSPVGVQQGGHTVPPQYQTAPSTVQAGVMPSLSVNTNASATTPIDNGLLTPSSPYGSGSGYNSFAAQDSAFPTTPIGTTTTTTAMLDNPVIPATTDPYNYFGNNGYGSITQASGTFPSTGSYNDFGAPGSITRNYDDPFTGYARATAKLRVQEGKTGNLTMSVGINSDSGLVGRFAIEERNFDWRKLPTNPFRLAGWRNAFRGAGQKFLIEAMPGENYQRYMVSFQEPLLGNTRFSLGLNGFYYTRYYDEWRENRAGGGVTLGRAWTDRFSTSVSFNGANVKVYDPRAPIPDLFAVLGNNAQYAFGLSGSYDTRDNTIMPTEGGTLTVSAEQVLGTARFVRGGYDVRRYHALWRRADHSGAWVLGLRSAANITEKSTPIYERYYAGGFSTIRGFEYRGVTPRWSGYGVGGNFEFYNSVELCFPISADDNFRGVFFVDSGTVETSVSKWESDYRVAPGFGIRLTIPMMGPVPIAFDFAFPINKNTGDVSQMFSFNMGFTR